MATMTPTRRPLRRRPRRSRSAALSFAILAATGGAPSCVVPAHAASVAADINVVDDTASGDTEAEAAAAVHAAEAVRTHGDVAADDGGAGAEQTRAGLGQWGGAQRSEDGGIAEAEGVRGGAARGASSATEGRHHETGSHWGTRTVEEKKDDGGDIRDAATVGDKKKHQPQSGGGGAFGAVPAKNKHGSDGHSKQQAGGDASGTNIPFVKLDVPDIANDTASPASTSVTSVKAKAKAENGKKTGEESNHRPPDGFTLAAHVVADPTDGLSYFVPSASSSPISDEGLLGAEADAAADSDEHDLLIPFLECGTVGSTTDKFPLRHGHFRHLPPGARPQTWTTTANSASDRRRKDPQLLVALRPVELTVSGNGNGGESRTFDAGDVVLLEDVVGRGHRLSPAGGDGLSVLLLTLPKHHHHHHHHHRPQAIQQTPRTDNRRHLSILGLRRRRGGGNGQGVPRPCRVGTDPAYSTLGVRTDGEGDVNTVSGIAVFRDDFPRRTVLGTIGLGLSTFLTYFLYQVAPPVLGLLGVASMFAGAAILCDGALGAMAGELEGWVEKKRVRMEVAEDGEDDMAGDDSVGKEEAVRAVA